MNIPSVYEVEHAIKVKRYTVHYDGKVNIALLRAMPGTKNAFDDMLFAFRMGSPDLNWRTIAMRCTTNPGGYLPDLELNCVWAPGQVIDGLKFGLHHGEYECLVPALPIPVRRKGQPGTSMLTQIHRASADHESKVVDKWSEGCTVVANPTDFAALLKFCRDSGFDRFTPTLLEWPA